MLELLNRILLTPVAPAADHILWHDLKRSSHIRLAELRGDVSSLVRKIEGHDGRRWLLHSDNPHCFLTGLLALLALGKEIVICASRKPEWLGMLAAEFDAILSDEAIAISIAGCNSVVEPLLHLDGGESDERQLQVMLTGDEKLVFYTSGSTGEPKAVAKMLRALTNEIDTLLQVFSMRVEGRIFMASVSHQHIYGLLFRVLLPLAAQGSGVIQQIEFPEQLLQFRQVLRKAAKAEGLVFISSPAFLSRLDTGLQALAMDAVFSSGGPLAFRASRESAAYFSTTPTEVYGSTETGGIGYRQQEAESAPWQLFPGMTLRESETGVGLLSPHMPGQELYELDDNLEILAGRRFILKGRKDRIVKIAEKRVSLTEIEKFLEGLDSVQQCVALPLVQKLAQGRDVVACAVVLTAEGQSLLAAQGEKSLITAWKEAMKRRFESVVIPRKWQILDEIPLNSQSKIDNARLLAGFTGKSN